MLHNIKYIACADDMHGFSNTDICIHALVMTMPRSSPLDALQPVAGHAFSNVCHYN